MTQNSQYLSWRYNLVRLYFCIFLQKFSNAKFCENTVSDSWVNMPKREDKVKLTGMLLHIFNPKKKIIQNTNQICTNVNLQCNQI